MATGDLDTVQYDPVRKVLLISESRLNQLAELIDQGAEPATWGAQWAEDLLVVDGRLDPLVEGIGRVVRRPARIITVERVAAGMMVPLFVVWDTDGRVVLNEPMADGRMALRLSSFDLLPSLLMQELTLLRALDAEPSNRQPLITTTEAIEALLTGTAAEATAAPAHAETTDIAEVEPVLAGVHAAWRVVGSWSGRSEHDANVIGLMADSGYWQVLPESDGRARVEPVTIAELAAELGDVVTGRDKLSHARAS